MKRSILGVTIALLGITTSVNAQWTTSGSNIYYNAGSVGIGTASPAAQFELVQTSSQSNVFQITRSGTNAFRITNGFGSPSVVGMQVSSDLSTFVNAISIVVNSGGGYSQGNVGIGTTSPLRELDVDGSIELSGSIYGKATDHTYYTIANGGNYNHAFYTRTNTGASSERFRIEGGALIDDILISNSNFNVNSGQLYVVQSTGNVGIGTTSPSVKFHVVDNVNPEVLRVESSSNSSQLSLRSTGTGGIDWRIISTADGASLGGGKFSIYGNAQHRFVLDQNGNVGIGTDSPNTKLEVTGLITGGFGAETTSGTLDWNHETNARSGSGYALLRGNATNGPDGSTNYYHPFNFEYNKKDGTGNITQFAIPYGNGPSIDGGLHMRGRYNGTWSNWVKIISEDTDGNVGISTATPGNKLEVNGTIRSKEVIVEASGWPDYVFSPAYDLLTLAEIEAHIKAKGHLPEVLSANEVEEEGQHLGEMQQLLLKKIEELTLHAINQEKVIAAQQELINQITSRLEQLESKN